jgi:hypothetical protein
MDLFILPVFVILYLMNGLDRSNIGNAAVGFQDALAGYR